MSQLISCHRCNRLVIITPRGGRLRSHKRWHSSANGMTLVTCPGSGQLPAVPAPAPAPEPPAPSPAAASAPPTIAYRCKVSPGRIIAVELPIDLSVDEMRRLCAFLMTQADDEMETAPTERTSGEPEPASEPNEHPDGCRTTEPGELRDCESDGHYSCRTCSKRAEKDQ